jgi:hypothetical protein
MTWVNQGFVMNGRWSEHFSSQVDQLILDFVVTENHEASFLAA